MGRFHLYGSTISLGRPRIDGREGIRKACREQLRRVHPDKVQQRGLQESVKSDAILSIQDGEKEGPQSEILSRVSTSS